MENSQKLSDDNTWYIWNIQKWNIITNICAFQVIKERIQNFTLSWNGDTCNNDVNNSSNYCNYNNYRNNDNFDNNDKVKT